MLVFQFRRSRESAACLDANFGIKGTLETYDFSMGLGFEVPLRERRTIEGTANPPHQATVELTA